MVSFYQNVSSHLYMLSTARLFFFVCIPPDLRVIMLIHGSQLLLEQAENASAMRIALENTGALEIIALLYCMLATRLVIHAYIGRPETFFACCWSPQNLRIHHRAYTDSDPATFPPTTTTPSCTSLPLRASLGSAYSPAHVLYEASAA